MSLILTPLKKPYEVSLTGNPMTFIWQVSLFEKFVDDLTLNVRVTMEDVFNSGTFREVYLEKLLPDSDGKIFFDAGSIVDAYLDYYTPKLNLTKPVECMDQRKRYRVEAVLEGAPDLPYTTNPTINFTAVKGGLSDQAWHYKEFFTQVISEDKLPLSFQTADKVDTEAPGFLYWIYPYNDGAEQTITLQLYLSDGSTVAHVLPQTVSCDQWGVCCAPVGFTAMQLQDYAGVNKDVVKYSVKVMADEVVVVDEYFYQLDHRNFYDKYFLIYRNSLGGLECQRVVGEVDISGDYERNTVRQTAAPDWFGNLVASDRDGDTLESIRNTGDTGFLSRQQAMKVRDLLLSREKYQAKDGRLMPIVFLQKSVKFYSSTDQLISISLEWKAAFMNRFYTQDGLMPLTRTCPAMEFFSVSQASKHYLRLLWSLEYPYRKIQVTITIGTDEYIYTYEGNTGNINQYFNNPVTDTPENITVEARTICDEDTVPVDMGVANINTVLITGIWLPVAVDDYFDLPSPIYTEMYVGNVLANDYDPGGDAIEAVAEWGISADGGLWVITVDGGLKYTPFTPTYTGQDSFDYHINKVGESTMVAGTVYLNVGGNIKKVYVKWIFRNVVTGPNFKEAEAWLEYFSDAICTVPLDITALNLTINAKMRSTGIVTGGNKDYSFVGTGLRKKMFEGTIFRDPGKFLGYNRVLTVLPGVGYTAVNP